MKCSWNQLIAAHFSEQTIKSIYLIEFKIQNSLFYHFAHISLSNTVWKCVPYSNMDEQKQTSTHLQHEIFGGNRSEKLTFLKNQVNIQRDKITSAQQEINQMRGIISDARKRLQTMKERNVHKTASNTTSKWFRLIAYFSKDRVHFSWTWNRCSRQSNEFR